ncbi:MAG: hypothetical protein JWQ55_3244 [Rhodopila sp.]|nr:hypothetical protein [Rhodopila sp.]
MTHHISGSDWLADVYSLEVSLSGILADFGYSFAPVYLAGDIASPGFYNIPDVTPVTTESVTYKAAGSPVSDTYTGTTLWNLTSVRLKAEQIQLVIILCSIVSVG